jgi:hypothetical protein
VRAEALQGIAERNDVVTREAGPDPAVANADRPTDDIAATDAGNDRRGLAQLARRI